MYFTYYIVYYIMLNNMLIKRNIKYKVIMYKI